MWKPADMPGIPREVTMQALCVVPRSKPTKQHMHHFDNKRHRAIGEEIAKLLAAGFIKEVYHSDWLANPVLVKRRMGNRECVLIILASTRCVQRTIFLCHVSVQNVTN